MRWTRWSGLVLGLVAACSSTNVTNVFVLDDGGETGDAELDANVGVSRDGGSDVVATEDGGVDANADDATMVDANHDPSCVWSQGAPGAVPVPGCFAVHDAPPTDAGSCGATCTEQAMYFCGVGAVPQDAGSCGYAARSVSVNGSTYDVSCCEQTACTRYYNGDSACAALTMYPVARSCPGTAPTGELVGYTCLPRQGPLGPMFCCDH